MDDEGGTRELIQNVNLLLRIPQFKLQFYNFVKKSCERIYKFTNR